MVDKKRRLILGGAVGATAVGMLGGVGLTHADDSVNANTEIADVPTTEEIQRVTIIGSGFGGGIAALRFAEAGIQSVVLERGIRWPTGPNADTFPRASSPDERAIWYETLDSLGENAPQNLDISEAPGLLGLPLDTDIKFAGLIEPVFSENMTVMCAAGVGGGSLVYQGMTLQPSKEVFNRVLPEALDYDTMDKVYYPRVAEMLKLETAPDELINSPNYEVARIFAQRVEKAGYEVEKIPMPIDWDFALRELNGEMAPAYTNGDAALGVNNGGKHSVDVTYIAQAEATGLVDVRTLHNVTSVAKDADGKWKVYVNITDEAGTLLEKKIITTTALVMAAGSVNTTKLLLKADAEQTIPNLPSALGEGWGTNADRIVTWTRPINGFGNEIQGGPVIYGSKDWGNPNWASTIIQASLPPLGMDLKTTVLVGFGVSDQRGTWSYDAETGEFTLDWKKEGDAKIHSKIMAQMFKIAGAGAVLGDTHSILPSTWHPLGGACMESVCDLDGRVHNHTGLYVLDGALIPGNTGACNPSMTIAAVAERAMDNIVRNDIGIAI
ncbi:GMC oxidoreductase [Microbulbifer pacificus]|uniref:Cholesterol oxidase n=1 Tax=Microbulbifer pacificus TaxID=407164 RepID=A0AAU0MY58_9GAMM|nr:GMC oxidoreductase [Microbulbifer pacificus]WOX05145.1 GMC oxidoreductase [Microbulbifer pacificus]